MDPLIVEWPEDKARTCSRSRHVLGRPIERMFTVRVPPCAVYRLAGWSRCHSRGNFATIMNIRNGTRRHWGTVVLAGPSRLRSNFHWASSHRCTICTSRGKCMASLGGSLLGRARKTYVGGVLEVGGRGRMTVMSRCELYGHGDREIRWSFNWDGYGSNDHV